MTGAQNEARSPGGVSKSPWTRHHWLLLLTACLVMLVESITLINTRWVEDDNWYSVKAWTLATEGRIRTPIFPFDPEHVVSVITTVYTDTEGAVFKIFGTGVSQARMVSAVFAIALVIVVYLLALDIGGMSCGLIAAFLIATDSFVVVAARTARPESETAFLCWLALLLLERALARNSVRLALAAGIACGLGLICHPMAFPFFAAMMVLLCLHYGGGVYRQPTAWVMVGGVAIVVTPYLAWCFSDAAHIVAFRGGYLMRAMEPLHERILGEADRWFDFIGVSSQRVPLLPHIPLRLHVAAIIAAALCFLIARGGRYGRAALILLLFCLGWLLFMVNKSPRYLTLLSPLFAIALAYLAAKTAGKRYGKIAAAALGLVLITQVAGDVFWLYRYRNADYADVTRKLQAIIPKGASVFGITTFWMALHEHPYYAYDRTDLDRAVAELHPQYMILYDRVMMHGSGYGDTSAPLRAKITAFVRDHGTIAGRVSNEFYGDLEIYRIRY